MRLVKIIKRKISNAMQKVHALIVLHRKDVFQWVHQRIKIILQNIKFVDKVIPQKTLDYVQNLKIVKPDFVVHGDDWKKGIQKKTRARVIKALKEWSGRLIEPKYTKNINF